MLVQMTCPDCHSRSAGRSYFKKPYCALCEKEIPSLVAGTLGFTQPTRTKTGVGL